MMSPHLRTFLASAGLLCLAFPGHAAEEPRPAGSEPYMRAAPSRAADGDKGDRGDKRSPDKDDRGDKRPAEKDDEVSCLTGRDARNAIRSKQAVALAHAARVARSAWDGELIDYRLCAHGTQLIYELTLLNSDGKVARARVDARSGKLIELK